MFIEFCSSVFVGFVVSSEKSIKLVQGASSEKFAVHQYKKRLFPG
jgi:hypothetical protein